MTRLCLDQLKSARRRRETYVGPWLPEPIVEAAEDEVDDVTLPLMLALERLSPLERAAFLLHDVFGIGFEEIAETIGREPAACRQLASRARTHVRAARPRFQMEKERGLEIAAAFFAASRNGDMQQLQSLLAADVTVYIALFAAQHGMLWVNLGLPPSNGSEQELNRLGFFLGAGEQLEHRPVSRRGAARGGPRDGAPSRTARGGGNASGRPRPRATAPSRGLNRTPRPRVRRRQAALSSGSLTLKRSTLKARDDVAVGHSAEDGMSSASRAFVSQISNSLLRFSHPW